jgi:hypothetical protein
MTATFAALLLAHALADFVVQTAAMAAGKAQRRPGPMALHVLSVFLAAALCLGPATPRALMVLLALTLAHLVIDIAKSFAAPDRLAPFLVDQAAHLAVLGALAALFPWLWAQGLWSGLGPLPWAMALTAGLILATRAGGFAVGMLMQPWTAEVPKGLTNGGRLIGILERGLIYVLVIVGQPAGIGFLIAAKSVLRFETTAQDVRAGEYVIIGTLASFGWAIVAAYAARALALDLGFPAATP